VYLVAGIIVLITRCPPELGGTYVAYLGGAAPRDTTKTRHLVARKTIELLWGRHERTRRSGDREV
jgi:hypothetical protein